MEHRLFREDKCTRCGECFVRCRYMELSRRESILEIERLIEDRPTRKVLQKCASCYACDAFCPEDARPYGLILEKWDRRYRARGLPVRASYLLPYHEPNYRMDMEARMGAAERGLLDGWKKAPAEGVVLYPGCNLLTVPYLYDIPALSSLPVSGDWSLCCGEPLFRMGLFEAMEKVAAGLTSYYQDKKIEKMVFICPACMNMFRNVLPRDFGARLDFECEYLGTWLLREIDRGAIEIKRPVKRDITIHDSCHGRVLGDEIMEANRELLSRLGLRVIDMKSHRENGICCGIAAGCNRFMPQDIMKVSLRELKEGRETGTSEMAIYCTGCYLMLNMTRAMTPSGQTLLHTLEYLALATSEESPRIVEPRTRKILMNVIVKAMPRLLSPRRYWIEKLEVKS